jgi:hypothetical protein
MVEEPPLKLHVPLDQGAHGCYWHDEKECGADSPHANPRDGSARITSGQARWPREAGCIGKDIAAITVCLNGDGDARDKKHQA